MVQVALDQAFARIAPQTGIDAVRHAARGRSPGAAAAILRGVDKDDAA
jgi:hypothetical protein